VYFSQVALEKLNSKIRNNGDMKAAFISFLQFRGIENMA
jgi:hypothetical protein